MEENYEIYREPKYTMRWLGLQSLYVLGVAFVLALIANGIDSFAFGRVESGLLHNTRYTFLSQSIAYCFGVIAVTSISLLLVEVAFRKGINYLQYALIEMALTLFYLLLLALSEKMAFGLSYVIVSVMTVGLIALFIKGITRNIKAVRLITGILVVEYSLIFILIKLGTMALLIGSFSLFVIIALAMYFTLKLKIENEELTIK